MRTYLGLAWAGMRHRPGGWLLLALGVALASLLPVVSAGLRAESGVAAVRAVVDALPPSTRAVLAVTSRDVRDRALASTDADVRAGLAGAGVTGLRQAVMFRPLSVGGERFTLGAVTDLGAAVRLTSGRLPARCTPRSCEVLAVSPSGEAPAAVRYGPAGRQLGLVVTGSAQLVDQRVVGMGLVAGDVPLLLGADPPAITGLEPLSLFGRGTAWIGTLDSDTVAGLGADQFTRTLADLSAALNGTVGPLNITWPSDAVTAASRRATAGADQLDVLGAGSGALLLGFGLVAAAGMRRRQQLVGRLLTRRGAGPGQILTIMVVQPLLAVAVGLVTGLVAGALVVAIRARAFLPDPATAAVRAAASAWPSLLALGLTALVLAAAVARWPETAGRSTQLIADAAVLVAVGGAVLLVSAGPAAAGRLTGSVVVLLTMATGLVAARLWRPLAALGARGSITQSPARRVALAGGRRRPLLSMVTAGFVAAACCSLVFAGAYRQSLDQSALDQAAAQVPLDVRVSASAQVATPATVVDGDALRRLGPGVAVQPVVSASVTAFAGSSLVSALPLTGLDPAALPMMHEYGAVTGATGSAEALARQLAVPAAAGSAPVIPAGTRRLSLQVRGATDDMFVGVWISTPDGGERRLDLTGTGDEKSVHLAAGPALTVRAVEIVETADHLVHRQHGIGEGSNDKELVTGTLRFGAVSVDGTTLPWPWADWGSDQAEVSSAETQSLTAAYQLNDTRVVLVPAFRAPAALTALPVAVDPDTAARAGDRGTFGLTLNGQTYPARIVAVLPRMPTVGPSFVLGDRAAVAALLTRTAPGTAYVNQLWISAPAETLGAVRAALVASPAGAATLTYREDLVESVRHDAVSIRSIWLLEAAGSVALLLAAVACAAAVRANDEESAGDHLALELDGAGVRTLRYVLLVRAVLMLGLGIVVGVLGGLALAAVAIRLVVTGPAGAAVVPPLRVVFGVAPTLGVIGVAIALCLAACGIAASTTFRDRLPSAPEVDLR